MAKKTFYLFIVFILLTFALTMTIKFYRPTSEGQVSFADFPVQIGEWKGYPEEISQGVLDLLKPQDIFSATYVHPKGYMVHLMFDFFSSDAVIGGPHSPRNCLPGSGWEVEQGEDKDIDFNGRVIPAGQFILRKDEKVELMDFWYATRYGETASDYTFKLYEILSALTFQPRDKAFIRFITYDTPESRQALSEFQSLALKEIYQRFPFDKN